MLIALMSEKPQEFEAEMPGVRAARLASYGLLVLVLSVTLFQAGGFYQGGTASNFPAPAEQISTSNAY